MERINKTRGPLRVWLKEHDYPGLAMTRSIGDHIARSVGVIATPEISNCEITDHSALIIGSDGLFEFMSNYDIALKLYEDWKAHEDQNFDNSDKSFNTADIITPSNTCKDLSEEAANLWKKNQSHIDDIS